MQVREHRQHVQGFGDLLLPVAVIDPGVTLQIDGSMAATFKYRGPDMDSATHQQMAALSARVNGVLNQLGNGWMVQCNTVRSASPEYAPESPFPEATCQVIDAERRQQFLNEGTHYETHYYLTFVFQPPTLGRQRAKEMLFEGQAPGQGGDAEKVLNVFNARLQSIEDQLKLLFPIVRLTTKAGEDDREFPVAHDEQLRFLRQCLTGDDYPFVLPDIPFGINDMLGAVQFVGGLEPRVGERHIGVIAIDGFPKASFPGILGALDRLPIAYRWNTRAILMDREPAFAVCDKALGQWIGQIRKLRDQVIQSAHGPVNLHAQEMTADVQVLRSLIASGEVRLIHYSSNIVLLDQDRERLRENVAWVVKIIRNLGFGARVEDINAVEAYLGTLHADGYRNVRRSYVHSLNLADLLPLTAMWAGLPENPSPLMPPHSPPLLYAATTGSTPFRVNLHAKDELGHTLVLGPTGSGKSTLLGLLVASWFRYPHAQVFVFDKLYSMYVLTKACGGEFYHIGRENSGVSFCPLGSLSPDDLQWAVTWIEALCLLQGKAITSQQRDLVLKGVLSVRSSPTPSLTEVRAAVQDEEIQALLKDYTLEGSLGHVLDHEYDRLGQGRFLTFETQTLMTMGEQAVVPVLLYLFRQIEKRLDGSPTLVVLDEAWLYLRHELFREQLSKWLLTLRKQNGIVVLATQSLSQVFDSPIRNIILESCPNKMLLSNSEAQTTSMSYYQSLGLNEREIERIQTSIPRREYFFISPLGRRLISLGLGGVALSFVGVNGDEERRAVNELMEAYPDDWQSKWLKRRGLPDWAAYYEEIQSKKGVIA